MSRPLPPHSHRRSHKVHGILLAHYNYCMSKPCADSLHAPPSCVYLSLLLTAGFLNAGICNGATKLVFSGTTDAPVASQGPFSFTGWFYNDRGSLPVGYNQGIRNTNTVDFITVTNPKGIYLCQITAQVYTNKYPQPTRVSIQGLGIGGQTVQLPDQELAQLTYADVPFDEKWQSFPLQGFAIIVTTPSLQFSETTLWEISYVLGP